ncbi:MAG: asparagine synthase-related protein [Candidatus Methanomethylophilus sp.]|nr:asparagine synthase-related protein [Methanomethylophilus sp.]
MSELSTQAAALLDGAVGRLTVGKEVAVAFSGGLDSGLVAALAARHAARVTLYTAGFPASPDVRAARELAPKLGLELQVLPLTETDLIPLLQDEIAVTGTASPLVLAFELPLFLVLRECRERTVIGGQGSDETFGGYAKYRKLDDLALRESMAADLERLMAETQPHEAKVAAHFSRDLGYPYLDRGLVDLLRQTPAAALRPPDDDRPKRVLRDVAAGLDLSFLDRPKKAAQYGSGFMDAVHRICRVRGITYNELVAELVQHR